MNFSALWLVALQAPGPNPAFMNVVEMWGVRVSTYNHEALFPNIGYKDVVTRRSRNAIGAKDMQLLMREKITAAW